MPLLPLAAISGVGRNTRPSSNRLVTISGSANLVDGQWWRDMGGANYQTNAATYLVKLSRAERPHRLRDYFPRAQHAVGREILVTVARKLLPNVRSSRFHRAGRAPLVPERIAVQELTIRRVRAQPLRRSAGGCHLALRRTPRLLPRR